MSWTLSAPPPLLCFLPPLPPQCSQKKPSKSQGSKPCRGSLSGGTAPDVSPVQPLPTHALLPGTFFAKALSAARNALPCLLHLTHSIPLQVGPASSETRRGDSPWHYHSQYPHSALSPGTPALPVATSPSASPSDLCCSKTGAVSGSFWPNFGLARGSAWWQ